MILVREDDPRFYLSQSTLPNAGLGVFTNVNLKAGDFLEIVGIEVEEESDANRCTHYAHGYKFASGNKGRLIIPLGFAGMVNHATDHQGQNMELEYLPRKKTKNVNAGSAILRVIKPVKAGDELFHYYGRDLDKELKWKSEALSQDVGQDWRELIEMDLYGLGALK